MAEDMMNEDDIVVVMTDEAGNEYYYREEMIIPVEDEKYALLVGIHDEDEEHAHTCGCGCEDDDEDVIIAKIVTNEDGEDEYVEPTDEVGRRGERHEPGRAVDPQGELAFGIGVHGVQRLREVLGVVGEQARELDHCGGRVDGTGRRHQEVEDVHRSIGNLRLAACTSQVSETVNPPDSNSDIRSRR